MDVRATSTEIMAENFPEGIGLLLASPPTLSKHLPRSHRDDGPKGPSVVRRIVHLILYLTESQPMGVGYSWDSTELHPPTTNTIALLG